MNKRLIKRWITVEIEKINAAELQGQKYYGKINYNIPRRKVNSIAIVLTLIRVPLQK